MNHLFQGKTILITGGTGFLGRELTREILKQNPASIRVYSRDEVKHYKFQEELLTIQTGPLFGKLSREFQQPHHTNLLEFRHQFLPFYIVHAQEVYFQLQAHYFPLRFP